MLHVRLVSCCIWCIYSCSWYTTKWLVRKGGEKLRTLTKNIPNLTREYWTWLKILLQVAIAVYLISHGVFGAFDAKAGLAQHYDTTGITALFGSTEATLTTIGWLEIALGIAVLLTPATSLLFFVCGWKIATESLFIFSGAFYGWFEFIERGASMVAPLALYFIIRVLKYCFDSQGVRLFTKE